VSQRIGKGFRILGVLGTRPARLIGELGPCATAQDDRWLRMCAALATSISVPPTPRATEHLGRPDPRESSSRGGWTSARCAGIAPAARGRVSDSRNSTGHHAHVRADRRRDRLHRQAGVARHVGGLPDRAARPECTQPAAAAGWLVADCRDELADVLAQVSFTRNRGSSSTDPTADAPRGIRRGAAGLGATSGPKTTAVQRRRRSGRDASGALVEAVRCPWPNIVLTDERPARVLRVRWLAVTERVRECGGEPIPDSSRGRPHDVNRPATGRTAISTPNAPPRCRCSARVAARWDCGRSPGRARWTRPGTFAVEGESGTDRRCWRTSARSSRPVVRPGGRDHLRVYLHERAFAR